jgi:hypothetical protein
MNNNFWDNIKKLLSIRNKPDIWLIKVAKLDKMAIVNGQIRHTMPSVDKAYRCARVLGVTVEELINGEAGAEYVCKIIMNDPKALQVPARIRPIVDGLLILDKNELIGIRANVEALAEAKIRKGTITEEVG